ncbi:MAG: hypothetical protein Q7U57_03480 [Methylovulum sp.]|nr:hypothetical protein [Methylovulum sp.]
MDAEYDIFEIVAVKRDFWLIDAESYQRMYCTSNGQPLAPGYYVVNWPEKIRARRFNEHATFHGPYKFRKEAQAAIAPLQQVQQHELAGSSEQPTIAVPKLSHTKIKNPVRPTLRRFGNPKTEPAFGPENPYNDQCRY